MVEEERIEFEIDQEKPNGIFVIEDRMFFLCQQLPSICQSTHQHTHKERLLCPKSARGGPSVKRSSTGARWERSQRDRGVFPP